MKFDSIFKAIVPITVATLIGTSAMGMDFSSLLGGGEESSSLSLCQILITEKPKDKKKLVMDGYSDEKQFLRINGEEKSIVSFSVSVETMPIDAKGKKKIRSHPVNPSLHNYDSAEDVVNYIKKGFEEKLIPSELLKFKSTKMHYHESELSEEKLNNFGKRKRDVLCPYTEKDLYEMADIKKARLDFNYDKLNALNTALSTKEFDVIGTFSYFDRQRELKVRLSTDRTQMNIDALPIQAEKLHDNANDFFNDIGEWLELTMDDKKELIVKERIGENTMYS